MQVVLTLLNEYSCLEAVSGQKDPKTVDWAQNLYYEGVDGHYVALEPLNDPKVVVARTFCSHLRCCGLLDGYNGAGGVKKSCGTQYQCTVSMVVGCEDQKFSVCAELTYTIRMGMKAVTAIDIDKEKINLWLYNLVYNKDEHDELVDMQMKCLLELQDIRCYVGDLEIEV